VLNTIPRASSFTLSTSTVNVGSTITATITRASTSFTHAVEFYINSTYYKKYTSVGTSQQFTIPDSWYNAMSSSSSCTAYCCVTTYSSSTQNSSTQIGSVVTKSFTVSASSASLTKGTISVDPVNINGHNVLLKGKNKIDVVVSGFKAGSGASIKDYRFDVLYGSTVIETLTTTSSSATLGPFNQSGNVTLTFKVTMTDSRGQSIDNYTTYTCYDYDEPYFISFDAYRANSNGDANVNGTWLKCVYSQSYSSADNNSVTVTAYYNGGTQTGSNGSVLIDLNGDTSTTYKVYLTIKDKYGFGDQTSTITVFGQSRVLNITSDGTGIAIGKMADKSNLFECRWPAKFDSNCEVAGNLTIGTSTQNTTPTTGIHVHDVRDADITPDSFGDKNANFYFDQIDSRWMGILHMKGWTGNYAAWELAGNAHNSSNDNSLKYRQGIGNTWGDWQTVITNKNINNYVDQGNYLPISGGILTGQITLPGNSYYYNGACGINCSNSDIIDVNSIYFNDPIDASDEGMHFYRSNGNWDTLYAIDGALKFHPNRSISTALSGLTIYNSSNFRWGTCTLTINDTSITFTSALGGTPIVILTPFTTTSGVIAGKVKSASSTGFTATIGGSAISGSVKFAYLAIYF
jgi:hypothetical protein